VGEDIGGWLRRVRPATPADDNWTESADADRILAEVHRQTGAGARSRRRVAQAAKGSAWRWVPAGLVAAAVAIVLVVTLSSQPVNSPNLAGPTIGPSSTSPAPGTGIRPAAYLLHQESTCPALLSNLRAHTAASAPSYGAGQGYGGDGVLIAPGAPSLNAATPADSSAKTAPSLTGGGTSTTTVQELGVDEPDIVKTDGDEVVTITDGVLRVIDAATDTVTGKLDLTIYTGWGGAQLLVDGSHALVILGSDSVGYGTPGIAMPTIAYPGGRGATSTQATMLFVDLSGQPTVTGTMRASGSYLDARMVGSTVRLVVHSEPAINFPLYSGTAAKSLAADRKAINSAPLAAWLPSYTVTTNTGTRSHLVPCDRTLHPTQYTGESMLTIYTLDMNNLAADPNPLSVTADGDTVYATTTSMYITSNPDWFCCTSSTSTQTTEIHRFDITGTGSPTYLGSGSVAGRLLSSYSLSDVGGYLRVATTSGGQDGSAGDSNSVVVLADDSLKVAGRVDGLGKGERIYAVRFVGALAYLITYQQTDPLYVIDLSDPARPRVAGAVKISGISDYLHDLGAGRLLGVGQQLAQGEGSGVQVSLFDVSNPSAPSRVSNVVVPKTPWELSFDPHTFLYWAPTGLIVVPVQSWDSGQSGRVLAVRVSGETLATVGQLSNPQPSSTPDDGLGIQRSMIVDGNLWTVSGGGVQVSSQSNLHRIAWIPYT
jgi:uncharacterized secreted protein with C-terminal beta-propeller domain